MSLHSLDLLKKTVTAGLCAVALACFAACGGGKAEPPADLSTFAPGIYAHLVSSHGEVIFQLLPERAPKTVATLIGLANGLHPFYDPRSGDIHTGHFYDGLIFHRLVPDFVVQGGDIYGTGSGTPGFQVVEDPALAEQWTYEDTGDVGAASRDAGVNGSQFFFTLRACPELNGRNTMFGRIVRGQETLEAMAEVPLNRFQREMPLDTIRIRSLRIYEVGADGSVRLAALPDGVELPAPVAPKPGEMRDEVEEDL